MRIKTIPMLSAQIDADAGTLKMDFTPAAAVVFRLQWISSKIPNPSEAERVSAIADYLQTNLQKLEFLPTKGKKVQVRYTAPEPERERIEAVLAEEVVGRVLAEISRVIKPATKPRKRKQAGTARVAGHLIDHALKPRQLDLFSELEEGMELQEEALDLAKLNFAEQRALMAISILLHAKSGNTTSPANGSGYYTGNLPAERVPYSGETATAPVLSFTWYELAKLCLGEGVGGVGIAKVRAVVEALEQKKYTLHSYHRKSTTGESIHVRETRKILSIMGEWQAERKNAAGEVVGRAEAVVLQLSPLFRDQIATKYIPLPENFYKRLAKASGKTTTAEHNLLLYLLREISANRLFPKIGEPELVEVLGLEELLRQRRAGRVREAVGKSIATAQKMGVVVTHNLQEGKTGKKIYHFELDKNWSKNQLPER